MSLPVTVSVRREADSARTEEALSWLEQGLMLAREFDGYLGGGVMRDAASAHVLHVVYVFRSRGSLDRWSRSEQRRCWSLDGAELTTVSAVQRRSGLEGWFDGASFRHRYDSIPGKASSVDLRTTPPRWKQAVAIWSGMLPLNLTATWLASGVPWWQSLPLFAQSFLLVCALVPAMTFVVMPVVTRILRPWLTRDPSAIAHQRLLEEALDAQCAVQFVRGSGLDRPGVASGGHPAPTGPVPLRGVSARAAP